MKFLSIRSAAAIFFLLTLAAIAKADDWPQWRGANRAGLSKETGLLQKWPEGGPKLLWKTSNLGEGHATPSVAGGRIYGMGLRNDGKDEMVWALDEKTGKEIWSVKIADGVQLEGPQGGYGSRATPTVDGANLFVLGVSGQFACMSRADGKILWTKNVQKEFGGELPRWGYSESALVDGDNVLVTPGGATTMVLLNKKTGGVVWKSNIPGNSSAYSSAITTNFGGVKEYIQFLTGGVVGVNAADGKLLWQFSEPAARNGINCSTPLYKDGYVFAASGYQNGGGLAKLSGTGTTQKAEKVYFVKEMRNHHGGMVLVGDYIYGFDERILTCIEFKTGKIMWTNNSVGKGSIMYADGNLICRSERGPVALVEASPTGYVEKGRFEQTDRSSANSWPYPIIANGKLYLRDQGVLLCYDVKGTK